jgi:hypothetical protein
LDRICPKWAARGKTDTDLADSGKEDYMKVVDNFDNFPESINTLLSDKRFRIMDLWKSGVLLEF